MLAFLFLTDSKQVLGNEIRALIFLWPLLQDSRVTHLPPSYTADNYSKKVNFTYLEFAFFIIIVIILSYVSILDNGINIFKWGKKRNIKRDFFFLITKINYKFDSVVDF